MTNLPQQDTIRQYLQAGVQATFVVPFYVPLETDGMPNLDVYVTLAGETPIPETDITIWGVDYTYAPNLDPITGGILTFLVNHIPPNLSVITIVRDVQASLDVEFSNATTFNGENLDNALDKLLLIEQQNKTYALQRNISYVVNSYLPLATLQAMVQIPVLGDNQIWKGTGLGVVAVTLEEGPDTSTLRSELAVDAPVTNGARLVGYYDTINLLPTTVKEFLDNLPVHQSNFSTNYGVDSGAVNALVAANAKGATLLFPGLTVFVKVANNNTGPATLNYNGLGVTNIVTNGIALISGNMTANQIYEFAYDGTSWELLNPFIPFASNTQALAGTDTTHPVTSAGLASFQSVSGNGYIKFPGGMIMQWGVSPSEIAQLNSLTITFPISFPNSFLHAMATPILNHPAAGQSASVSAGTQTQLVLTNTSSTAVGEFIYWTAIGN